MIFEVGGVTYEDRGYIIDKVANCHLPVTKAAEKGIIVRGSITLCVYRTV
jgi:hypothetical protein